MLIEYNLYDDAEEELICVKPARWLGNIAFPRSVDLKNLTKGAQFQMQGRWADRESTDLMAGLWYGSKKTFGFS